MKLRVARHTTALEPIITFYSLLGLNILGSFEAHDGYNGVFLGFAGSHWHLEFTVSDTAPHHQPDDDLLVFYPDSLHAYQQLIDKFDTLKIVSVLPQNPYWSQNGVTYADPDGYRIVIAMVR